MRSASQLYGEVPAGRQTINDDEYEALMSSDFAAEYWIHLRTTNPIEPTFATVPLRTEVTRRVGLVWTSDRGEPDARQTGASGSEGGPGLEDLGPYTLAR